ncbi:MAG TPA: aminoglycoside adenylyltransferase domain-containing protein [Gaiellaceae bacterium]|nr:aminoglycoside adenylyltransferase domain-containing protein [Gaiellaceae bacterium]
MAAPTRYPELNFVLRELLDGARAVLSSNLVGAYLQGSFAVGGADEHSDVDFVIVTNSELEPAEECSLQELHARLYGLDVPWAQHLEGSYIPRERLRHVDPSRSPFLYLDNGASELVRDPHCNTAVARWSLRECGIVLAGPDPKQLIDPISPVELRREALDGIAEYAAWAPLPTEAGGMSRWKQTYLVVTLCRLLHTLDCGRVASKRTAAEWALEALPGEWTPLIQAAIADRPDPWIRVHQPADPMVVARTLAFAEYAVAQSKSS